MQVLGMECRPSSSDLPRTTYALILQAAAIGHLEGVVQHPKQKSRPASNKRIGCCDLPLTTQNEILPPNCQNRGSWDEVAWPKFPSGKFMSMPPPAMLPKLVKST